MPQKHSKASSDSNENVGNDLNYWDLDKRFKKKERKQNISQLLYNFTPKSDFEKALLLGVLPSTRKNLFYDTGRAENDLNTERSMVSIKAKM